MRCSDRSRVGKELPGSPRALSGPLNDGRYEALSARSFQSMSALDAKMKSFLLRHLSREEAHRRCRSEQWLGPSFERVVVTEACTGQCMAGCPYGPQDGRMARCMTCSSQGLERFPGSIYVCHVLRFCLEAPYLPDLTEKGKSVVSIARDAVSKKDEDRFA